MRTVFIAMACALAAAACGGHEGDEITEVTRARRQQATGGPALGYAGASGPTLGYGGANGPALGYGAGNGQVFAYGAANGQTFAFAPAAGADFGFTSRLGPALPARTNGNGSLSAEDGGASADGPR